MTIAVSLSCKMACASLSDLGQLLLFGVRLKHAPTVVSWSDKAGKAHVLRTYVRNFPTVIVKSTAWLGSGEPSPGSDDAVDGEGHQGKVHTVCTD